MGIQWNQEVRSGWECLGTIGLAKDRLLEHEKQEGGEKKMKRRKLGKTSAWAFTFNWKFTLKEGSNPVTLSHKFAPSCSVMFYSACQVPLSLGFSWQEYRSRLLLPPPWDLLDAGIKPGSPAYPALAGRFFITELPGKPVVVCKIGEMPPHLAAVWRWSRYLNSAWSTPDKKSVHPSRVTWRALNT